MVAKRYLGKLRKPFLLGGRRGCLRRFLYPVLVACAVLFSARALLTQYVTSAPSPELGLLPGDRVLVDRLFLSRPGQPSRGDAVAFRHPDNPAKVCLGRVEACPGDTVEGRFIVPPVHVWVGAGLRRLVPYSYLTGRPLCVSYSVPPSCAADGAWWQLPRPKRFFLTIE